MRCNKKLTQTTSGIRIQELEEISGRRISIVVDEKTAISPLHLKIANQPVTSIYNVYNSSSARFNIDFSHQPEGSFSLFISHGEVDDLDLGEVYCWVAWDRKSPPDHTIKYQVLDGSGGIYFRKMNDNHWSGRVVMDMSTDRGFLFFHCVSDNAESLSIESIKSTLGSLVDFTPGTRPLGYEVLFK